MQFHCPKCKTLLSATAENAGQVVACPTCQSNIKLPSPKPVVAAAKPVTPVPPQGMAPANPLGLPPANANPMSPHQAPNYANGNYYQPRKKSGSGKWIWIGAGIAVFGVLLLVGVAGLIYWMTQSSPPVDLGIAERDKISTQASSGNSDPNTNPNTDRKGSGTSAGPALEYKIQPGTEFHYDYRVFVDGRDQASQWNGTISAKQASDVSANTKKNGSWLLESERGQGVAIAPNIVLTSHELVMGSKNVSVMVNGKTVKAELIDFVPSVDQSESGPAILRTSEPVTSEYCFNRQYLYENSKASAYLVYRDSTGAPAISPIKPETFLSRGKLFSYATSDPDKSDVLTPEMHGALVVSSEGILGIVGHVPDTEFPNYSIVGLSGLQNLLNRNGVRPSETPKPSSSQPDALKNKYGSATVQITVQRPANRQGTKRLSVVNRVTSSEPAGNRRLPGLKRRNSTVESGAVLLEPIGMPHSAVNLVELPFAIGSPCSLMWIPIDNTQGDSWTIRYPVAFMSEQKEEGDIFSRMHSGYRRSLADKSFQQTDESVMIRNFSITDRSANKVKIDEVMSLRLANGYSLAGKGTYNFDTNKGRLESGQFKGTLTVESTSLEFRIPYEFDFSETTATAIAERGESKRKKALEVQLKKAEELAELTRALTEQELDDLATRLSARVTSWPVVDSLGKRKTIQPHSELSAQLYRLATKDGRLHTGRVAPAAKNFMTDEDVMKVFEDIDLIREHQVQKWYPAFVRVGFAEFVPYLCDQILENGYNSTKARDQLRAMDTNPDVEKKILEIFTKARLKEVELTDYTADLFFAVLGKHGSQLTIDLFDDTAKNRQPPRSAVKAYREIKNRLGQE